MATSTKPTTSAPAKRYLTGVQGLRTVAALLVAVYHIWFHRVSGGVDVFFVVAGFFAAGSLTRLFAGATDSPKKSWASFTGYLLRTGRRVVPSAVAVVVGTVAMALFWMPKAYWASNIKHGFASLLNYENWHLISESSDYLQQDLEASPFQQFWALSVNVQFYVLIACAAFLLSLVAVRKKSPDAFSKGFRILVIVVLAISFAYSVYYTAADQSAAYFSTFTRLWEFMVGSLAFLLLKNDLGGKKTLSVLGWLGLAALLLLGAFFDLSTLLPGYLSWIPVLAALSLILASWEHVEPVVLTWRPVLWVADASFAFYLWHWPLLVFYRYKFGYEVSFAAGLAIIFVAGALAVLTTKAIEDPIRNSKPLVASAVKTLVVLAALMALGLSALGAWNWVKSEESHGPAVSEPEAAVEVTVDSLTPAPVDARQDVSMAYARGCHQKADDAAIIECDWGDPDASNTIALVGGSHSLQWLEAVLVAAEQVDAQVYQYTKSNCLFGVVEEFGFERDASCAEWNEELMEILRDTKPDLVVTIGTRRVEGVEQVPQGYTTRFEELSKLGIPVLALRDNPAFDFNPVVCVEEETDWDECTVARGDVYVSDADLDFPQIDGVTLLDLTDLFCNGDTCGVVDGTILQYRDDNHLTTTWIKANTEPIVRAVQEALQGR